MRLEIAICDYMLNNQSPLQNESLVFYKSELPGELTFASKLEKYCKNPTKTLFIK
jgi:hypothetical protein